MTRPEQVIWAAGFIDGEGFVGISRGTSRNGRPCHQPMVDVTQARQRAPLDLLVGLFGGRVRLQKTSCGPAFNWRVTTEQARLVLLAVLPYLVVKRPQADLLLQYSETLWVRGGKFRHVPEDVMAQREAIYQQLRRLNARRSPLHAERLSESTPSLTLVRPAVNG